MWLNKLTGLVIEFPPQNKFPPISIKYISVLILFTLQKLYFLFGLSRWFTIFSVWEKEKNHCLILFVRKKKSSNACKIICFFFIIAMMLLCIFKNNFFFLKIWKPLLGWFFLFFFKNIFCRYLPKTLELKHLILFYSNNFLLFMASDVSVLFKKLLFNIIQDFNHALTFSSLSKFSIVIIFTKIDIYIFKKIVILKHLFFF